MFSRHLKFAVVVWLGVLCPPLVSAQPLVDAAWLSERIGQPGVVILDVRGPYSRQSRMDYLRGHIPGAIYSSYEKGGWRTTDAAGINGQLPAIESLEKMLGELGIGNRSHVVIVTAGGRARDTASGTRIYWTLKVLGHESLSLLDGGMDAWLAAARVDADRFPLEEGENVLPATVYKAKLQEHMLVAREEVQAAAERGADLIDNRPYRYFSGGKRHRQAKRAGTIDGAINVPERNYTRAGSSLFKSGSALTDLLADAGGHSNQEQINFCNTGHWASLGWFVSHELLGNEYAKLYDGSMLEWTADPTLPVSKGK